MNALSDHDVVAGMSAQSLSRRPPSSVAHARLDRSNAASGDRWRNRSRRWSELMIAGRSGDEVAYAQLLRELNQWLRAYYARRLPHCAAEDARQEALLAIHAKRHTFEPSKPFGAWVAAIARYKWVDLVRDVSRYKALAPEEETATEGHESAAISVVAIDQLLGRLKPAQENVIRLVKLNGFSIARASGATGQSVELVKINIHRGMKKLAAMVS